MEGRVSLEFSIMGVRGVDESIAGGHLGSEFIMKGKMRVRCRKWVSLEACIHGVEIMEENCSKAKSLKRYLLLALGILRETIVGRGNVLKSLHHRGGMVGKQGHRQGNGRVPRRRFPWEGPFFENEGSGTVHFSNGDVVFLEAHVLWAGCYGRVHCRKGLP